jgi:hypothetical protein
VLDAGNFPIFPSLQKQIPRKNKEDQEDWRQQISFTVSTLCAYTKRHVNAKRALFG